MSNTFIHIGYWIVILLILFVGYLIYPNKRKVAKGLERIFV